MKSCRWVPLLLATVVSVLAQDGVDHCIGLVWRKGGNLDLKTLIDPKGIAPQFLENIHLHHDAVYEMRSITDTSSLHGHQATYDSQGNLIQTGIAAGTADYRRPYMFVLWSSETIPNWTHHLEQDVKPFIRALQLDGNPVVPIDCYQNLNRQCLHVGEHTQAYLARRPTLPSGFIDVDAEASD